MSSSKSVYDRYYRLLLIVTVLAFVVSLVYIGHFYHQNGDVIKKDVSLTGGTTITIYGHDVNIADLKEHLVGEFPDVIVERVSQFNTGEQAGFYVEASANATELSSALSNYLGFQLTSQNSSTSFTGSELSAGFYAQLKVALLIAFVFMAIVIFVIFRTPIPSLAVILSAFGDIVMTLAVLNFSGMVFSMAGVIAFLMLIGYSVDTDILLTARLLKTREHHEDVDTTIFKAMKTGLTMTFCAIAAVGVALAIVWGISSDLRQIFLVLLVGLCFDIFNTWVTNVVILKWYVERRRK